MLSKQFACTYQTKPGTLALLGGSGQFTWTPTGPAGAKPLFQGSLSNILQVRSSKASANVNQVALRIEMKPVPPATTPSAVYDLRGFQSVALRDEATALLRSPNTRSNSPLPPGAMSSPQPTTPITPAPTPSVGRTAVVATTTTTATTATTAPALPSPRKTEPVPLVRLPQQPQLQKMSVTDMINTRIKLLQKDEKLRKLHQKLVGGKIVSEEDFWVGKESMIAEQRALEDQAHAFANTALLDPTKDKVELAAKKSEETVLTPDMIQRIFVEHPDVERKFRELVPNMLSESQFWTSYLHSRYVLGTRRNVDFSALRNNPNAQAQRRKKNPDQKKWETQAEELFGSVDLHRLDFRKELDKKFQARMKYIDPEVNLASTFNDAITTSSLTGMPHAGYGIMVRENDWFVSKSALELARSLAANKNTSGMEKTKEKLEEITLAVKEDPLLSTINERASLTHHLPESSAEERESKALRNKRIKQDYEAELRLDKDLDLEQVVETKFEVKTPTVIVAVAPAAGGEMMPPQRVEQAMPRPFDPTFAFPNVENHFTFLHDSAAANQFGAVGSGKFRFEVDLPSNVQEAFIVETKAVDEFCRHFWAANTTLAKRCLIVSKMKEVSRRINGPLREAIRAHAPLGSFLIKLPLAQLSRAMEEHALECKNCGQ